MVRTLGFPFHPSGASPRRAEAVTSRPGRGGQWKPLWRWLEERQEALIASVGPSRIAFGEWCYAQHFVLYDALPDWFLLFDVYDREQRRFWSRERRDRLAREAGLSTVPLIEVGTFTVSRLQKQLGGSRLGASPAEGICLRWDEGGFLVRRAKIVRPGWVMAGDARWSSRPLKTNRLAAA